jgi:aminoglycoside phosphotransferase family enzyme
MIRFRKQLLVLDCIDFNPQFYNIDTLSDIAMLGVDIEMHTMADQSVQPQRNLSEYFLYSYLKEAGEDRQSVRPLLEYYLAEKAMVRAFMCILYDSQLLLGEKYLEIALRHVQRLEQLILDKKLSLFLDKISSVAVGSK